MTRSLVAVTALLVAASCGEPAGVRRGQIPGQPASSVIAPGLAQLLSTQPPGAQLFVVVQYNPAATDGSALATRIMGLGAAARGLARLPFVGALATPPRINAIAAMAGVVRVTDNRQLHYFGVAPTPVLAMLDRSVPTIKADQARARFGLSGLCHLRGRRRPRGCARSRAAIAMSRSRACVTGEVCAWKM